MVSKEDTVDNTPTQAGRLTPQFCLILNFETAAFISYTMSLAFMTNCPLVWLGLLSTYLISLLLTGDTCWSYLVHHHYLINFPPQHLLPQHSAWNCEYRQAQWWSQGVIKLWAICSEDVGPAWQALKVTDINNCVRGSWRGRYIGWTRA